LPRDGESRSLTTPREKMVKISTSVVRHGRYVVFQVASSASPKSMSRASPVYPADLDYDDTWGFALGVQHVFADRWLSSLGGGYDTSPMSKSDRTPTLPMDPPVPPRHRHSVQLQRRHHRRCGLRIHERRRCRSGSRTGPLAGRIQGDYKSNDFHFFNVNLSWRF
jgi:hypothetical protein